MTIYPFHWLIADGSGTSILVFGGWWDAIPPEAASPVISARGLHSMIFGGRLING